MSSLKEVREILVYFYMMVSYQEYFLLYNEIDTRKRIVVASLSLFAIYVLPHFSTLHSS